MSINKRATELTDNCAKFLRDIVKIPSESTKEKDVAFRIAKEMETLKFDEVFIDDYGNVIGRIGTGPIRIIYDAHIDTVGIGAISSWEFDPYDGKVEDGVIYGRGASDDKGCNVVQVYGAALFKELKPELLNKISIYVVGTVQEEDCDGLGLRYAIEESIKDVHYVCIGEATNLDVYRGQRGRMEIVVNARGVSCHGSAPERGDNAVYRMMRLVGDIEKLNEKLQPNEFLGKGTCVVSNITCDTPSLCAVPDGCHIHIDRRLTEGENKELAVRQIEELPSFEKENMSVEILRYNTPSYKGKVLETEKYYPTWVLPEDHPFVQAGVEAATEALGKKPAVSRWVFSTNGVSSMGQLGIPTMGFGPGNEVDAHTVNDCVSLEHLEKGIAFYAALGERVINMKK